MKWIEIKGSVGEQMLRYTLALSMNKGGDEVGVTGASEKFHATFPALPRFQQKRISLTDWISRAFGSNQNDCTDWLSYKYAESLGNNIHSYFSIAPSQIPADFASIMPKLQCDNVVAVHVVHSDKGLCSCTPDYYFGHAAMAGRRAICGTDRQPESHAPMAETQHRRRRVGTASATPTHTHLPPHAASSSLHHKRHYRELVGRLAQQ